MEIKTIIKTDAELYREAIDILVGEVDFEKLGIEIAKTSPSVFIRAYNKISMPKSAVGRFVKKYDKPENIWWEDVFQLFLQDKIISAIKEYRRATGLGLKDSKTIIDSLKAEFEAARNLDKFSK